MKRGITEHFQTKKFDGVLNFDAFEKYKIDHLAKDMIMREFF